MWTSTDCMLDMSALSSANGCHYYGMLRRYTVKTVVCIAHQMLCTPVVCGHTSPTELCYGYRMPPFFPLKRGLPPKNTSLSAGNRWCSPVARRMARSGVRSQYSSPNYYIPGEHSKLPWLTHKAHIGVLHTPNRWCMC